MAHRILEQTEEPVSGGRQQPGEARWWNHSQVTPQNHLVRLSWLLLLAPATPDVCYWLIDFFFSFLVPKRNISCSCFLCHLPQTQRPAWEHLSWAQVLCSLERFHGKRPSPGSIQGPHKGGFPNAEGVPMLDSHKQTTIFIPTYFLGLNLNFTSSGRPSLTLH